MDSLSVGIRVPSIDCDGESWTRVNTDPRNDLFFPDALLSAWRRVAGIRLEWWPPSTRNSGRDQIGIPGRLALEFAPENDAPTPCGTGKQSVEGSDLSAILFGHGGFNIAKSITRGVESDGLYVFSAT